MNNLRSTIIRFSLEFILLIMLRMLHWYFSIFSHFISYHTPLKWILKFFLVQVKTIVQFYKILACVMSSPSFYDNGIYDIFYHSRSGEGVGECVPQRESSSFTSSIIIYLCWQGELAVQVGRCVRWAGGSNCRPDINNETKVSKGDKYAFWLSRMIRYDQTLWLALIHMY